MKNGYKNIALLIAAAAAIGLMHDFTRSDNPNCGIDAPKAKASTKEMKGKTKMANATAVSAANFDQEVLQAKEPVLVDFWAPWCAPCRMLAPTVDELAAEYAGKAKVVKVNTDENQDLAAKYSIKGIPTLMLFKDGEVVDRVVGVQPKPALADRLDKVIEK